MAPVFAALVACVWLWASAAAAQEIHSAVCLHGCPKGSPASNDLIIREIYILSSNDSTKFADWVAYRVTKDTVGPTQPRSWKADPLLAPEETLEPGDYTGANAALKVDRGHQAALASLTGTPHWRDTNYLSNITPQKTALNQGPWGRLEAAEQGLARAEGIDAVYVMTGPFYERDMPPLPRADEPHKVPSGYWKIIAIVDRDAIRLAAFEFDQETPRRANMCDHRTTVANIEARAALDFFHALSLTDQLNIEQNPGTLAPDLGCPLEPES